LNQLIVYTPHSSPRVDYIFSTLLKALGLQTFIITTDKILFQNSSHAKINYSTNRITDNEFWIQPVSLLYENDIKAPEIVCFKFGETKAFFETHDSDFPFDIFAASFYLISRYEEYLPYKKDVYGRYAHQNSLAYKTDFLKVPLVNVWLKEFRKLLSTRFPSLTLHPKPFTFRPTYDIDIAFSYLHKGAVRNLGGFIKSMWSSEWALVKERMNVLFGKQQDPFDSYRFLNELHKTHHFKPIYFFLIAQQNKDYDKNILPQKEAMKNLIKQHSEQYDVGIHPSWQSNDNPELLKQEIDALQNITGKPIKKNRQHYIKMELPETYRRLLHAGITEDYSMGYGSINGFRASFCLPHLWYDLQKEEATALTIFPFCYMDANSYYEQHYSSEEALFITIWHNHFLGTDKMFTGWRESYKTMIEKIDRDFKETRDKSLSPQNPSNPANPGS
jgi:hypothetical protein